MDFLLEFAATGRIGAVRVGMPLSEAEDLLGPGQPRPMYRMRPDATGYPYRWGSLSLGMADGVVDDIKVNVMPGDVFHAPAALWPRLDGTPSTFEREEVLAALTEAGCPFETDERIPIPDQTKVRTKASTVVVFNPRRASETLVKSGDYLTSMYSKG